MRIKSFNIEETHFLLFVNEGNLYGSNKRTYFGF